MAELKKIRNSSITRVRPVFLQLLHKNNTDWISRILNLCNSKYAEVLSIQAGSLLKESIQKRKYCDPTLKQIGIKEIFLENCFEYSLPPPLKFLEWLILNPTKMKWPGKKEFKEPTQTKRKSLLANNEDIIKEALSLLNQAKSNNRKKTWWMFEGYTEVDCLLETEKFFLGIEGKRTENGPSISTSWYPQRNQIVRNLEALQQYASGKGFGLILIDEKGGYNLDETTVNQSLPHLSQDERKELLNHYLGNLTWQQICSATGISYSELPETIEDI